MNNTIATCQIGNRCMQQISRLGGIHFQLIIIIMALQGMEIMSQGTIFISG